VAESQAEQNRKKATAQAKLTVVKNALIEILAESKQGMSLAQIPLHLKKKNLPFTLDLNELGFPKLKDLILSMSDQIRLELMGHNHPIAYLLKSNRYVHQKGNSNDQESLPTQKQLINYGKPRLSEDVNTGRFLKSNLCHISEQSIEQILAAFYAILRERPWGIQASELAPAISAKTGVEFDFRHFGCDSLLEFLKKFVIPSIDIEIIYNSPLDQNFLIRSPEFVKQLFVHHPQMQMQPEDYSFQL